MNDLVTTPQTYSFIATTPAMMERSQQDMIHWFSARIEQEKLELAEIERAVMEVQNAGMKDAAWKRRAAMSRAKITFFRKVKAALASGYYIVPPFPVQLFAIRTDRDVPATDEVKEKSWYSDFVQSARVLPQGEGRYVSPFPTKEHDNYQERDDKGALVNKQTWYAGEFQDVDFPFKLVKPEIIAAVGRALQEKIFDTLGVLPHYKKPDPIVVGQIIPPHRRHDPLTFFVAWWMDPKDL